MDNRAAGSTLHDSDWVRGLLPHIGNPNLLGVSVTQIYTSPSSELTEYELGRLPARPCHRVGARARCRHPKPLHPLGTLADKWARVQLQTVIDQRNGLRSGCGCAFELRMVWTAPAHRLSSGMRTIAAVQSKETALSYAAAYLSRTRGRMVVHPDEILGVRHLAPVGRRLPLQADRSSDYPRLLRFEGALRRPPRRPHGAPRSNDDRGRARNSVSALARTSRWRMA
jgi:hypothetical protein